MTTPLDILKAEFPSVHEVAIKTCVAALGDARISRFYALVAPGAARRAPRCVG